MSRPKRQKSKVTHGHKMSNDRFVWTLCGYKGVRQGEEGILHTKSRIITISVEPSCRNCFEVMKSRLAATSTCNHIKEGL